MTYTIFYALLFSVLLAGTGMFQDFPPSHLTPPDFPERKADKKIPALYLTRSRWMPLLPVPDYIYDRLPSSFTGDLEAGLTSSQFDIAANVADGDTRAGLDQRAKQQIRKIMKNRGVDFDEARRVYTEQRFARNNIGPDGRPRDPKFVSFS